MTPSQTGSDPFPSNGETNRDYLFDMMAQLARLAREMGESSVAIHLEAIIAARLADREEESERRGR